MRHYEFQDPNDRSPNSPAVIASATRVRALYNQANPSDKMENITQKVKDWFIAEAQKNGWSSAEFAGNECLLKKNF